MPRKLKQKTYCLFATCERFMADCPKEAWSNICSSLKHTKEQVLQKYPDAIICQYYILTTDCPIPNVSKDCEGCTKTKWRNCVYVKVWQNRKHGATKSSPYIPLATKKAVNTL